MRPLLFQDGVGSGSSTTTRRGRLRSPVSVSGQTGVAVAQGGSALVFAMGQTFFRAWQSCCDGRGHCRFPPPLRISLALLPSSWPFRARQPLPRSAPAPIASALHEQRAPSPLPTTLPRSFVLGAEHSRGLGRYLRRGVRFLFERPYLQLSTRCCRTQAVPIGFVGDYAGSTAPSFWLLCYGQAISRTTYATLFARDLDQFRSWGRLDHLQPSRLSRSRDVRQGRHGWHERQSAHQSVRRARWRYFGSDGRGGDAYAHHSRNASAHAHRYEKMQNNAAGSDNGIFNKLLVDDTSTSSGGITNQTTPTTSNSTGGGGAHNNVQPTIILNKIIFAGV